MGDGGAPRAQRLLQAAVASCLGRLTLQRADLLLDLARDVGEAQQVGLGRLQLQLGLPAFRLVPEDSSRLLDDGAPVLRLGGQDLVDLPLFDGGVQARADLRARQELLDVLEAATLPVQGVLALPRAVEAPGHHHLLRDLLQEETGPGALLRLPWLGPDRRGLVGRDLQDLRDRQRDLTPGQRVRDRSVAPVAVVAPVDRLQALEVERHLRHPQRPLRLAAVEDDVLHPIAAQGARPLLPQDPGDGVTDVALAAAVRPDHGGDPLRELEQGPAVERLEADDLHPVELQEAGHASPAARVGVQAGILAHPESRTGRNEQPVGPPAGHDAGYGRARSLSTPARSRTPAATEGRRAPDRGRRRAAPRAHGGRRRGPRRASSRANGRRAGWRRSPRARRS